MTAPAFAQSGTAANFALAASIATPLPATVVAGELGFLCVSISDALLGVTLTWPSGWTQIGQLAQGSDGYYAGLAWRRLDGSEGGTSVTTSFSATVSGTSRIATYTGAKTTGTPWEAMAVAQGNSATADSTAFATTEGNERGVVVAAFQRNALTSPGSGWTENVDSGANNARITRDSKLVATPTSEGVDSRTISVTTEDWITWTYALLSDPILATLDAPLGGANSSAAATVEHEATLAAALGALAGAAIATVEHAAIFSAPLAGVSASAAATVEHDATLAAALGGASSGATATVERAATLAAALGALAAAATATVEHGASFAAPLQGLSSASTATVEHEATFSAPLGFLLASASAVVDGAAVFAAPLGAVASTAIAQVEHEATFDAPLGSLAATLVATPEQTGAVLDAPLGELASTMTATVHAHARKLELIAGPFTSVLDFHPRRRRLQAGDCALVALTIRDGLGPVDVSDAPLLEIALEHESGATIVRRASAGQALGRVEYRCVPSDLLLAGEWQAQARAVRVGGGEVRSPAIVFFVGWNLPTS